MVTRMPGRDDWRDDFNGTALDATAWKTLQSDAGMSAGVASSILTLTAANATGSGAKIILRSVKDFPLPAALVALLQMSAKTEVKATIELVDSVDQTSFARIVWDPANNASATVAQFDCGNGGFSDGLTAVGSQPAVTSYARYVIKALQNEVAFLTGTKNNNNMDAIQVARDAKTPDPTRTYFIQITLETIALTTAQRTLQIDSVHLTAWFEHLVSIMAGSGDAWDGGAIPTRVMSTSTTPLTSYYPTAVSLNSMAASAAKTIVVDTRSSSQGLGCSVVRGTCRPHNVSAGAKLRAFQSDDNANWVELVSYTPADVGRVVTDGTTTNASTTVTSPTAAFTSADVGKGIAGTGIPAGATIASVSNATTVIISAPATASGVGNVTLDIDADKTYTITANVFQRYVKIEFDNGSAVQGVGAVNNVLTAYALSGA